MTPTAALRFRRNAPQWHALVKLEREIHATDPYLRRKYLRDFRSAFRSYESVLEPAQLTEAYADSDVLLIGDYHALRRSQEFAAELVAQLAGQRPIALGLETIFARHQDLLDQWIRGEIDEQEFRCRLRFDVDWGYDWTPFYRLLETARARGVPIYGLDCMPRNDLRHIAVRDRHAADRIAEIRQHHPESAVLVLIGESHLAPSHLPLLLAQRRPQDRLLTVLQNVDALYWRVAGERAERVHAVRVSAGVVCVFNATPLEKYESYRLCIDRWSQERAAEPDFAPAFYNLVDALLRFLNVDKHSPSTGTQPQLLVDQLPEIHYGLSEERLRRLLSKAGAEAETRAVMARLDARGCCYVPQARAVFMNAFQLENGAEEAARFAHHACRGFPAVCSVAFKDSASDARPASAEDCFYVRVLEDALAYFGSRALHPARASIRERDLSGIYSSSRDQLEELGFASHHEFQQVVDFLVLHKHYEANLRSYRERPSTLEQGFRCDGRKLQYAAGQLGYLLGSELYDAYVSGAMGKRSLRSLFLRHLDTPGVARTTYFALQRKLRGRTPIS